MAFSAAMHNWMRPEPLGVTLDRLERHGYAGLEISGEPAQYEDLGQVRALLEQHGIECWGAVTIMTPGRDLLHEDRYVRQGTVEYVKDVISLAGKLGGEIVAVVPSTVGKVTPTGSAAEEWRWAVESLKACQEHAEAEGVKLALEPLNRFETYFLNRCDQALALADDVGGNCGVCLDAFHMNIEEEDWAGAIRAAGPRLYDFHIADNNRMPPGYGSLDWVAIVGELDAVGYKGCLTVEFVGTVDRSPVSPRTDMLDASETEGSESAARFIRDHGGGALSDETYDRWVRESIEALRAATGAGVGEGQPTN